MNYLTSLKRQRERRKNNLLFFFSFILGVTNLITIKTFRGRWRLTQRECSNAIAILTSIDELSKNGESGRIRSKDIRKEVALKFPECRVSDKLLWQLAYCGFMRISKCVFPYHGFNVMYYSYSMPKKDTFSVATIKEDVANYIKYKEEADND